MSKALLTLALTACVLLLAGCSTYFPAGSGRAAYLGAPQHLDADDWPARDASELRDLAMAMPPRVAAVIPARLNGGGRQISREMTVQLHVRDCGAYGRGIIRRVEPLAASLPPDLTSVERRAVRDFEGLQFASFSATTAGPARGSAAQDPQRRERRLLRRLGVQQGPDGPMLASSFVRMKYQPALAPSVRGVIVHLSSLSGGDFERPLADDMRRKGWTVIWIDPSTARRSSRQVFIDPEENLRSAASRLAWTIDQRIAEIAYAAEAGVAYAEARDPRLAGMPVLVLGFSAGALAAPAVAELLHDRTRAVVLVGGGADLLSISQRSTLTNGGIHLAWKDGRPDDAAFGRLVGMYRERARLDPFNVAPCLRGKPVLMLHAKFDDIIPADCGELLYARLAQPDRAVIPMGHVGLFWRLPAESGAIAAWLTGQTRGRPAEMHLAHSPPTNPPTATSEVR